MDGPVAALSTIHDDSLILITRRSCSAPGGMETIAKPSMIIDYTNFMGGVDVSDQLTTYYGFTHWSKKWWKHAFIHLLVVCMVNAYILHSSASAGQRSLTPLDFILSVARELLEKCGHEQQSSSEVVLDHPQRLVGRNHFP